MYIRLELRDAANNHFRFWEVGDPRCEHVADGSPVWLLDVQWGRIHTKPQTRAYTFDTERECIRFREQKVSEKLMHGYKPMPEGTQYTMSAENQITGATVTWINGGGSPDWDGLFAPVPVVNVIHTATEFPHGVKNNARLAQLAMERVKSDLQRGKDKEIEQLMEMAKDAPDPSDPFSLPWDDEDES